MTHLQQSADKAMNELPTGWSIRIDISRDSADVELYEPDGDLFEDFVLDQFDGQCIENAVSDAVDMAIEVAAERASQRPDPRKFG